MAYCTRMALQRNKKQINMPNIIEENYIQRARNFLSKKIDVEEDLLNLYTLLVLTTGFSTTFENVHEAWGVWKNKTNPHHKSLIPFSELSSEVQELDREYAEAIRETVRELLV